MALFNKSIKITALVELSLLILGLVIKIWHIPFAYFNAMELAGMLGLAILTIMIIYRALEMPF